MKKKLIYSSLLKVEFNENSKKAITLIPPPRIYVYYRVNLDFITNSFVKKAPDFSKIKQIYIKNILSHFLVSKDQ